MINYNILAVGYIYNKRNVRLSSDVPFFIYTTMPHNSIHVAKKVFVGIVNYSHHSPPCGGGARGWGFVGFVVLRIYTKKRTTRITRTGLSKNNVTLIVLNHAKTAIGPKKIIT